MVAGLIINNKWTIILMLLGPALIYVLFDALALKYMLETPKKIMYFVMMAINALFLTIFGVIVLYS